MALVSGPGAVSQPEITQGSITRVLVIGFSAVIALLLAGGGVAIRRILSIQHNAAEVVRLQGVTRQLIQSLEQEQKTLSQVFYRVTGDPDTADAMVIARSLEGVQKHLKAIQAEAQPQGAESLLWVDLREAAHSFDVETQRLLATPDESPGLGSRDLFRAHERVINSTTRLVEKSFEKISEAEQGISAGSAGLNRDSLVLLGASLLLAIVCSAFTVRATWQLFRNMAWQENELTRVSWQMLADQESIARRFSHELHDELGQSLAALKSNLQAMRSSGPLSRISDSMQLVDEAIGNVRQLSQLLRPMILDDFGLDAGLNWLCEGFAQRTGIEVDYASTVHSRLPDTTETHLFRIAQEALTNVARHSAATHATVRLDSDEANIRLTIEDDGRGLSAEAAAKHSLGMTGMRARARATGGVFRAANREEGGLRLEAVVPRTPAGEEMTSKESNESNPNLVG